MNKNGQVIFKDLDGNMIMNRKSDLDYWDDSFIKIMLEADARERGVRIIKNNYVRKGDNYPRFVTGCDTIECTVDYLSRKVKR